MIYNAELMEGIFLEIVKEQYEIIQKKLYTSRNYLMEIRKCNFMFPNFNMYETLN